MGSPHTLTPFWGTGGLSPHPDPLFSCSGKISYYTHPPKSQGVQLEAQILPALGPALDLEALERGDAEALAGEQHLPPPQLPLHPSGTTPQNSPGPLPTAVPVTVTGLGLSPVGPEEEEEGEAMEDNSSDLEVRRRLC